jgi:hypothetical protein
MSTARVREVEEVLVGAEAAPGLAGLQKAVRAQEPGPEQEQAQELEVVPGGR